MVRWSSVKFGGCQELPSQGRNAFKLNHSFSILMLNKRMGMIATIVASAMILIILEGFIYLRSLPIMPPNQANSHSSPKLSEELKLTNQGNALLSMGKYNESISYFDKALNINPKSFDTLYKKGVALLNLKEYNQSISYFDKALSINPKSAALPNLNEYGYLLYNKGFDLLNLGKYNESISYFDKALSILPNYTNSLIGKGIGLFKLGKYNESISYFDKALSINPKDVNALDYKNLALAALNKR